LNRFTGLDIGTNLTVRTFGGDDDVYMRDSFVELATNIRTANGISWVAIETLDSADLFIHGGNHQDDVALNGLSIVDDLTIQGYLGSDWNEIGVPEAFPWEVLDSELTFVGDRLTIRSGDGDNLVDFRTVDAGMISIVGGVDFDEVYFTSVFTDRNAYISTLTGGSIVDLLDTEITTNLIVVTGSGEDDVFVADTTIGTFATINSLGGSDIVDFDNVDIATDFNVFLGDHNDDLTVTASSANHANFHGQGGFDRYFHGGNSFGSENVFTFEQQ
jgi:hypothetical protein